MIVRDVAGIGGELREARKDMALQAAERREMGDMTDEMMGHVEESDYCFSSDRCKTESRECCKPGNCKKYTCACTGYYI